MDIVNVVPGERLSFARGERLDLNSSGSTRVASVISGVAAETREMKDGRQQIVALYFPGSLLGAEFGQGVRPCLTARTNLSIYCSNLEDLSRVLRGSPEHLAEFVESRLQALDDARDWLLLLGRRNACERVAGLILYIMCKTFPNFRKNSRTPLNIDVALTRTDFSACLGLTAETVTRCLSDLALRGVIRFTSGRVFSIPCWRRLDEEAGDFLRSKSSVVDIPGYKSSSNEH